ncbi:MAG: preprotein translocase subunit SecG [Sphingomonadales bacterium]|nr:preprotein translocase subunit SecG [Sphingomonadales bacterium]
MLQVLMILHLMVALALVATILLQRADGGALGIGGGAGGMMSSRGSADALTKATKWLAIVFIGNSLLISVLASNTPQDASVFDEPVVEDVVETPTIPDQE